VITHQEQALINSLTQIFPNAYQMLCIWHIEKNLVTKGTKYIKNKTSEHAMIKKWNDLIHLSSPSAFSASFSRFSSHFGTDFQKYMDSQRLLVAKKYSNAWKKSITHFDNQTTSRIESGHAFIKSHLLGPNHSFTSVVKMITNALEAQAHKISAHFHQQKINSLRNIAKTVMATSLTTLSGRHRTV
jgi:hypothetical protein